MKKILTNNSGFTLVEIMIAMGISIIIALAAGTIITTYSKNDGELRRNQDKYSFEQQLKYENKTQPMPTPDP